MGKISKWILSSLAVGAIQAQDFEVTNCEDANVSLIWRIPLTESKHLAKWVARRDKNYITQYFFWYIKIHFFKSKIIWDNYFRVIPPYLWESRSSTLMLISMLIKMISLWIMGTMRRHLREVLSIWFMMMPMTVSRKILEFNLVLNILIVFSELILSYTLGTPQTQHIALNSNVNIRYFFIFSQSIW